MSFVNAIISEEDSQFELYGHYKIWWECEGIWSTYYFTYALVENAVKDYVEQSKQGLGPLHLSQVEQHVGRVGSQGVHQRGFWPQFNSRQPEPVGPAIFFVTDRNAYWQ